MTAGALDWVHGGDSFLRPRSSARVMKNVSVLGPQRVNEIQTDVSEYNRLLGILRTKKGRATYATQRGHRREEKLGPKPETKKGAGQDRPAPTILGWINR